MTVFTRENVPPEDKEIAFLKEKWAKGPMPRSYQETRRVARYRIALSRSGANHRHFENDDFVGVWDVSLKDRG